MEPSSGSRAWSRTLPAGPQTAAEARGFLSEALRDVELPSDVETAALLTSEVATNAARHGHEPIELSISVEHEELRVSVFDHGPGFDPEEARTDLGQRAVEAMTSGWGLYLLDSLANEWGVDRGEDGTEVWFRL
jgi:anti-sigma regulatory factor (Ser/Thr protein kinase)